MSEQPKPPRLPRDLAWQVDLLGFVDLQGRDPASDQTMDALAAQFSVHDRNPECSQCHGDRWFWDEDYGPDPEQPEYFRVWKARCHLCYGTGVMRGTEPPQQQWAMGDN